MDRGGARRLEFVVNDAICLIRAAKRSGLRSAAIRGASTAGVNPTCAGGLQLQRNLRGASASGLNPALIAR